MSNLVREKLEAYFTSINPTCKRMMEDITYAKFQHGEKWDVLSPQEQDDALWKALVNPEIENKFQKPSEILDVECFPVLRLKPGSKLIVDEDSSAGKPFGSSWRDEHSAPFRWETQSQLNLTFCENDVEKNKEKDVTTKPVAEAKDDISVDDKKDDESKRHLTIKRPEVPPPPVPPHATPPAAIRSKTLPPQVVSRNTGKTDIPIYAKVVKRKVSAKTLVISEMKAHKKALAEMKPAVPPRMSLELKVDINDPKYKNVDSDDSDAIPKTGFDFLDNW